MREISRAVRAAPLPAVLIGVLLFASLVGLRAYVAASSRPLLIDFHAFYCGARVALQGANPYLQEPIARCEAPFLAQYLPHGSAGIAMPAPLPGYVFALVAPLTMLPFRAAAVLWLLVLCAAVALTIVILQRLSGLAWPIVALAVVSSDAATSLALGQLAPLAVLGLAASALALRHDRPRRAACCAAATLVLPQVALPVLLVLFVHERRARATLAAILLTAAAISVAMLGWYANVEYVARVLPAHALSERNFIRQLALAPMLYQLGVPTRLAFLAGGALTLGALVTALAVTPAVVRAYRDRAFVVLVPSVFALIGGTFLHVDALAAALPCALALNARGAGARPLAKVGFVLAAVPWMPSSVTVHLAPLLALTVFVMAYNTWRLPFALGAGVAGLALCVLSLEDVSFINALSPALQPVAAHFSPNALAEVSWRAFMAATGSNGVSAGMWLGRWMCVLGPVALAGALVNLTRERPA
ncbi:MAG: glycosyltransferase 87 family protein [Vulcanimicrobiaceae bacterium]